jgi:beta-lactamase class A
MVRFAGRLALVCALIAAPTLANAADMPGPLAELQTRLAAASTHAPGHVAIAVKDLATGYMPGINANANMPAASTIKIPVMVEVFRQMAMGAFDLNKALHVQAGDRDWGWGDLADARTGTRRTVAQLLRAMIEDSDNTATNMLIRLVGRAHINQTMYGLGLVNTRLGDYIRSDGDIRSLRTSARDMVRLLESMARARLIDEWSSREMLAILTGQHHNSLIPAPLPKGLSIAHKTGTLHDTLNDVGIVYLAGEPYVIAVMTTRLPDLDVGRRFIRRVSRLTFTSFERIARWREMAGLPAFAADRPEIGAPQPLAPDVPMWDASAGAPSSVAPTTDAEQQPVPAPPTPQEQPPEPAQSEAPR